MPAHGVKGTRGANRAKPGKNPGAGRPTGSRNRWTKDSLKKLEELGFDPVEKLVETFNEWDAIIDEESQKDKPSASNIARAQTEKRFIAGMLIPYRYHQVRVDEDDPANIEPLKIEAIISKKE